MRLEITERNQSLNLTCPFSSPSGCGVMLYGVSSKQNIDMHYRVSRYIDTKFLELVTVDASDILKQNFEMFYN